MKFLELSSSCLEGLEDLYWNLFRDFCWMLWKMVIYIIKWSWFASTISDGDWKGNKFQLPLLKHHDSRITKVAKSIITRELLERLYLHAQRLPVGVPCHSFLRPNESRSQDQSIVVNMGILQTVSWETVACAWEGIGYDSCLEGRTSERIVTTTLFPCVNTCVTSFSCIPKITDLPLVKRLLLRRFFGCYLGSRGFITRNPRWIVPRSCAGAVVGSPMAFPALWCWERHSAEWWGI